MRSTQVADTVILYINIKCGDWVTAVVELNGFALFNTTIGFKLLYPMIASVQ
ncbi:hypothetical protein SH449x_003562 [Pirellulaceae bacterium SH449]